MTPESGTLTAVATALQGAGDVPTADAEDSTVVNFEPTPAVTNITVTKANVFAGDAAPGKPVELNVVVRGQAVADADPTDDPILKDYPVKFVVDHGFLSPDAKGAGLSLIDNDLLLTADQDDLGDRFGFYQDLGADETVDTSDDPATNASGVVAAIA